jgi:hypothetical protein
MIESKSPQVNFREKSLPPKGVQANIQKWKKL